MMEQWLYHDRVQIWLRSEIQARKRRGLGQQAQGRPEASLRLAGERASVALAQRKSKPDWGYFTP